MVGDFLGRTSGKVEGDCYPVGRAISRHLGGPPGAAQRVRSPPLSPPTRNQAPRASRLARTDPDHFAVPDTLDGDLCLDPVASHSSEEVATGQRHLLLAEVLVGCHEAGQYDAGMGITVNVA